MKDFPIDDPDSRCKKVKFIVFDADRFEIWREWHQRLTFKDDSSGFCFQYAQFGKKKPCWATLWFSDVEGVYTAFVETDGAYVDCHALEKAVWKLTGLKPTPDNQTNQTNFHNHIAWQTMERNLRHERLVKCAEYRIKEATNDLTRYCSNNR
jgi:hypothetical protein